MSQGFPQFDCWSNSFRAMWNTANRRAEQGLIRWRSNWVHGYGHLNAWRTHDIQVADPNVATDMSLALEGYYLMKEMTALRDFGIRWRMDREGLWREICEYWSVADVLPLPPEVPPES